MICIEFSNYIILPFLLSLNIIFLTVIFYYFLNFYIFMFLCFYVFIFTGEDDDANPWGDDNNGKDPNWALQDHVPIYKPQFDMISKDGFVSGAGAKSLLTASGLPTNKLRKIWELSDIDKDGHLDLEEFVIAMYLSEISKLGEELPSKLDPSMIPKGKK